MVPGIPVGTSLIDAHAGGVGVIESVPPTEAEGCHYYLILVIVSYLDKAVVFLN